mmetsp:Transcript_5253/g.5964  ORF Transcript_5253/g.5964 Transcript_5253/m.5964 type:complete len:680 (-) Transcript_5253:180-2219(-)
MASTGPLISAKFDPTNTYLASGVIALDTHQVRVQSINPSQSSLNSSFNLDKSSRLTALSWISYNENQLIAIGLSKGSILVYSPLTNEIISELVTPTNLSIQDFHYSKLTQSGWSCDIGGNIHEWDLTSFKLLQTFAINDLLESSENISRISTVLYEEKAHLLVGSHSVYLIEIQERQILKTFPAHVQPIDAIYPIPNNNDLFLTSAVDDRFINLYSISKQNTKAVFVAQASILEMALGIKNENTSVLVMLTENGTLEIFNNPLSNDAPVSANVHSKKKRRQQLSTVQSRSSNASVKLARPQDEIKSGVDMSLSITAVSVNDDSILFSWLENANLLYFESIKWLNESGEEILTNSVTIEKSKPDLKTTSHSDYGHDIAASKHYNEGNAIVTDGSNFKDLDNESDENEDEEEETLAEKLEKLSTDQKPKQANPNKRKLGSKNAPATLTIVLSQSLKSNDHSLLETVLSNRDPHVIQSTISRLDSSLAVILLDRLAERITRQTSRFDQLNYWLKWIIIIHGGVLTSFPNLNIKLSNLHAILSKKADTLPRLLELQGRLNMLYQQNDLKKEILRDDFNDDSDNAESDVEYVEELDDAELLQNGHDDSDDEMDIMDGQDDYMDSDIANVSRSESESESESEDEEPKHYVKSVMDLEDPEDEEAYSDVEIAVKNDDISEDDEEDQ